MNLFEYQARELLQIAEIPVHSGFVFGIDEIAESFAPKYPEGYPAVVKAQVKVGGRGKAGGVKVVRDVGEYHQAINSILGMDIKGHTVNSVLVVPACEIIEEYYASIMFDRSEQKYLLMLSKSGGMDIEEVAEKTPELLIKVHFSALTGLTEDIAISACEKAGFIDDIADNSVKSQIVDIILKMWQVYLNNDATLVEINPLALISEQQASTQNVQQALTQNVQQASVQKVYALDAKITLDDNAEFRHKDLYLKYNTIDGEDELEIIAKQQDIAFVKLDGEVGIIGNGAGLVMSSLDLVTIYGESEGVKPAIKPAIKPANFLDIGGGASAEHMEKALLLVLQNPNVKSVFINIFGGLTQGTLVAGGIIQAVKNLKSQLDIPVISVRLSGNEATEGLELLQNSGIPQIITFNSQIDAAKFAINAAKQSGQGLEDAN